MRRTCLVLGGLTCCLLAIGGCSAMFLGSLVWSDPGGARGWAVMRGRLFVFDLWVARDHGWREGLPVGDSFRDFLSAWQIPEANFSLVPLVWLLILVGMVAIHLGSRRRSQPQRIETGRYRLKRFCTLGASALAALWSLSCATAVSLSDRHRCALTLDSGILYLDISPEEYFSNCDFVSCCEAQGWLENVTNPFDGATLPLPLVAPLVLLAALRGVLWFRDYPRLRPGFCPLCGYDLTGNVSGVCPECGEVAPQAQRPQGNAAMRRRTRTRSVLMGVAVVGSVLLAISWAVSLVFCLYRVPKAPGVGLSVCDGSCQLYFDWENSAAADDFRGGGG